MALGIMNDGASLNKVVLATRNTGKIVEMGALLEPHGIALASARDYALPEPAETGYSFEENARLKACAAAQATAIPAIADDSGLCVNALDGRPGIYSARWAGPDKDFYAAMQRVRYELGASDDWSAAFVAVIALALPDGSCETFQGRCEGQLVWPPRGENGFGYDPMFMPYGARLTFGEMVQEDKHRYSHRFKALHQLMELILNQQRS